jgi:ribosome modulation factor
MAAPKPKRRHASQEPGDPYAGGADAATAGAPPHANPYDPDTMAHAQWADGWKSAKDDKAVD